MARTPPGKRPRDARCHGFYTEKSVCLCACKYTRGIWHLVAYKIIPPVALLIWLPVGRVALPCRDVFLQLRGQSRGSAREGRCRAACLPACPRCLEERVVSGKRIRAKPRCQTSVPAGQLQNDSRSEIAVCLSQRQRRSAHTLQGCRSWPLPARCPSSSEPHRKQKTKKF